MFLGDEEDPKRDEVKERRKTEEGRKRQINSSCLLIKQPRGEALSPLVKAELRWVTQGSGPHSADSGLQHRARAKAKTHG